MKATLEQVLAARERRVEIQNRMLKIAFDTSVNGSAEDVAASVCSSVGDVDASAQKAGGAYASAGSALHNYIPYCVVCLTMNIAGEVKRTPMTRMLFDRGLAEFERLGLRVIDHIVIDEATGSEAFWLLNEDGSRVKKLLEKIEDGAAIQSPGYSTGSAADSSGDSTTNSLAGSATGRSAGTVQISFPAARLFDFDVLVLAEVPEAERRFLSGACFKAENGFMNGSCFKAADGSLMKAQKLSRAGSRQCLICDRPAAECARSRAHGLDAVKAATQKLLRGFCADTLARAAYGALLSELYTTPKPGLVDLNNNGAHTDMDVPLFERSAAALVPYFRDAALLGMEHCSMTELRSRGITAENEMFASTDGVNTHKGMIYSMGLLLAGMGRALTEPSDADSLHNCSIESDKPLNRNRTGESGSVSGNDALYAAAIRNAALLAKEDAEKMLAEAKARPATNGADVYNKYGAAGATGHAAAGFPDAVFTAERLISYTDLAVYDSDQSEGQACAASELSHCLVSKSSMPPDDTYSTVETDSFDKASAAWSAAADRQYICNPSGILALCDSMARLEDTNLLHRGGREGLEYVQKQAAAISQMPVSERITALKQLDTEMIRRNLSPGGSADMLAIAFLLLKWQELCRSL